VGVVFALVGASFLGAPTNSSINLLFIAYPLLALPLAGLTLSII
jgi:hypothetical protein